MALVYEGMMALLIGAGVIWIFWMTGVAIIRTRKSKDKK